MRTGNGCRFPRDVRGRMADAGGWVYIKVKVRVMSSEGKMVMSVALVTGGVHDSQQSTLGAELCVTSSNGGGRSSLSSSAVSASAAFGDSP